MIYLFESKIRMKLDFFKYLDIISYSVNIEIEK